MNPSKPLIRIALADDHKLILQAYTSLLNAIPNFQVVGCACNGRDALDLLAVISADVLILDASMPVMNGYETLRQIKKTKSNIRVIILTMHTEACFIHSFLLNGANAFLGKNCEHQELIRAIEAVYEDGYYFSSTVSKTMTLDVGADASKVEKIRQLKLTERETDILKMICDDISTEDIARQLNVSLHTVKFFKKSIYRKTSTSNNIGLIKYAIRHGIFAV